MKITLYIRVRIIILEREYCLYIHIIICIRYVVLVFRDVAAYNTDGISIRVSLGF